LNVERSAYFFLLPADITEMPSLQKFYLDRHNPNVIRCQLLKIDGFKPDTYVGDLIL